MCGIAGANLAPTERVNIKCIARAMLLDIESRGQDATGFAYRDVTGAIQVHKSDIPASIFVRRNLCLDKSALSFIAHTRFATQGRPKFNENNHPIATGTIVGVHNGHVNNDDALFRRIDNTVLGATRPVNDKRSVRIGEVDSEAIFSLLAFGGLETKVALEAVQGGAAVAWLDKNDAANTLHLARLNSSPLIVGETESGSILFASTQSAVEAGAKAGGFVLSMIREIPEGTYMTVVNGEWDVVQGFEPAPFYTRSYTTVGSSFKGGTKHITDAMSRGGHAAKYGMDADEWDDYYYENNTGVVKDRDGFGNGTVMGRSEPIAQVFNIFNGDVEVIDPADDLDEDELDDPEAYAEWWELNCMALDERIARDNEADEAHFNFAAFQLAPKLNAYYLSNVLNPSYTPDEQDYLAAPGMICREENVRKWMAALTTNDLARAAHALKADIRPGDTVKLDLDGLEIYGHVYVLPTSFPHGEYIVRAYIPNKGRPDDYEAIFVARQYFEFDVVTVVGGKTLAVREPQNEKAGSF